MTGLIGLLALLQSCSCTATATKYPPRGVHLAFGADPSSMAVYWATYATDAPPPPPSNPTKCHRDIAKGTSCASCKTSGDCPHLPGCDGHDCCYAGKCMCGKEDCPSSKPPSGDDNGHYGGKCPSAGCGGSHVQWGLSVDSLTETNSSGLVLPYTMDEGRNWSQHTILMTGLKPATKYFYRVGDPATGWSRIFHFRSQDTAETIEASLPQVHLLYGDLGSKCAFSLSPACTCSMVSSCSMANTSAGAMMEVLTPVGNPVTMVLHVGDFAYNMGDADGYYGDQFFDLVENMAAQVPYMVSIGNHEGGGNDLSRFTESFRHMPANDPLTPTVASNNGVAPNDWWFSWDDGLTHYIAINTNLPGNHELWVKQWEFVKADLERVNKNRSKTPWVLVHGHQSIYCSCDGDCDGAATAVRDGPFGNGTYGMEELLFNGGVDFFINGHEHDYERNWPTYKGMAQQTNIEPNATIYIVTGSAGCQEMHEPFTKVQPARSAFRSNTFGYSKLVVHNSTHARWQQIMTDPTYFGADKYGVVIDDTWVVQSHHGPFDPAGAPKTVGERIGVSHDHWDIVAERNGVEHADLLSELRFKDDADGGRMRQFVLDGVRWENAEDGNGNQKDGDSSEWIHPNFRPSAYLRMHSDA